MADPLSEVISLLKPRAVFTKGISGAGRWAVRYAEFGHPGFCTVIEGNCRLAVDGEEPVTLAAGDFVLLPKTPGFTMSSLEPGKPVFIDPNAAMATAGEVRHGKQDGPPNARLLGGYFMFEAMDTGLLVSLLPRQIHVRGAERLSLLVKLVADEAYRQEAGRDLALARLVEVLLIEALRSTQDTSAPPGLLRGLRDARLAEAIREMHRDPSHGWSVEELAGKAALSRSGFFDRFSKQVGVPPMEYLLGWRMALAKDLLRNEDISLAEVAERVGYGSASTFSTAFSKHVGTPPGRYARAAA
ncbi:MAG: AraC family transcriptional regulator [Xanthobacteraceae bacterium]|nr:AraC family transcriptional regulator [Xanthobacteraceae bacterium]QYK43854.1 MAG: AraC family transcriptional regulator [Xanthobacteraceae bacterium]